MSCAGTSSEKLVLQQRGSGMQQVAILATPEITERPTRKKKKRSQRAVTLLGIMATSLQTIRLPSIIFPTVGDLNIAVAAL